MAVSYDNDNEITGTAVTSLTVSSFAVANNANRLLVAGIAGWDVTSGDTQVSTITWNGSSTGWAQHGRAASADVNFAMIWRLIAPTATTASMVVTMAGTVSELAVQALSAYGVDQTTPLRTIASDVRGPVSATTISSSPTSQVDDLVYDVGYINPNLATISIGAGQTLRMSATIVSGSDVRASTEPGAAGTTAMTWGLTGGGSAIYFAQIAAAIAAAIAAPTYRSLATVNDATAENITATEPAGAAENDILRADLYIESDTPVTAPSGWSDTFDGTVALAEANTSGQAFRHYAYWIRRGASAPALTWTHASAFRGITVQAFSGAVQTEHPWSFLAQAVRDDTSAKTYPNVSGTTDTANELLTWGGRFFTESSSGNTQPTGFTERNDGVGLSALLADLAQASAGSTGTVTGASFGSASNHPATSIMAGLKSVSAGGGDITPPVGSAALTGNAGRMNLGVPVPTTRRIQ